MWARFGAEAPEVFSWVSRRASYYGRNGRPKATPMSITTDSERDFAELIIDQTWNGQPLAKSQHTYVRLMSGPWDPEIWRGTSPLDGSGDIEAAEGHLEIGEPGLYLRLEAPFHGNPPPEGPPGPTPRLWHHEVVELFIVGQPPPDPTATDSIEDGSRHIPYLELEMSPWGHYLLLRLQGVRQVVADDLRLPYRARRGESIWWGEAFLPCRRLPQGPYRANAFAMYDQGGARQHLAAVPVPGALPDFHRLSHFPPLVLPAVD